MSRSDADHLEKLKLMRDAIVDNGPITSGKVTLSYEIRGRKHEFQAVPDSLELLQRQIDVYEQRVRRATQQTFRAGHLSRPRGLG